MRRLVLAIIAVVFLQIAFYTYTAMHRPAGMNGTVVSTASSRSGREVARESMLRAIVPSAPTTLAKEAPRARVRAATVSDRKRPAVIAHRKTSRDIAQKLPTRNAKPYPVQVRSRKPVGEGYAVHKVGAAIPRGYTMVLLDYEPANATIRTADIKKTRKRSFLARTLPALVKKPWSWMKSLASKLD